VYSRRCPRFLSLCVLLQCALAVPAYSQVPAGYTFNGETATPMPGTGHDYMQFFGETVNPASGQVSFRLQYPLPKGRGFDLPYLFTYDSAGQFHLGMSQNGLIDFEPNLQQGGPRVNWSESTFTPPQDPNPNAPPQTQCNFASGFTFTDASGQSHNLGLGAVVKALNPSTGNGFCLAGQSAIPQNTDGRVFAQATSTSEWITNIGQWFTSPGSTPRGPVGHFTVTDEAGTSYFFQGACGQGNVGCTDTPYQIEDRNGNLITSSGDTLGHQTFGTNSSGQTTIGGIAYPSGICPVSSCPSWITVNYPAPNHFTNTAASPASCPPNNMTVSNSGTGLALPGTDIVTLPTSTSTNLQQYVFYFGSSPNDSTLNNPYGLLSEVVYPSGGWIKYKWHMSTNYQNVGTFNGIGITNGQPNGNVIPYACTYQYSVPVLISRQVSYDGINVAQTQSFTYSTTWPSPPSDWTTKTTSVTTSDSVTGKSALVVYNYAPVSSGGGGDNLSYGSIAKSVPAEQSILYYDWGNTSTPVRTVTKSWYDAFSLLETDTAENGQTKKTKYCYVGSNCLPGAGGFPSPAQGGRRL